MGVARIKVAIVTGGGSGIGKAIVRALAREGFELVVIGRSLHTVQLVVEELRQASHERDDDRHMGLALDVSDESDMHTMSDMVLDRYGRIDLLVASAGIGKRAGSTRVMPHSVATLPQDEWEAVLGVNLTGVFLSNRAVLPTMIAQGEGHIINIGSSTTPHGLRGRPYAAAYSASKYAMVGLTESLAAEVGGFGIRVQAVFPGPVDTPLVDKTALSRPFGGSLSAENFAGAVMFLVGQPLAATVVHPHILPFRGAFSQGRDIELRGY